MTEPFEPALSPALAPLPYHEAIRDYLKAHELEVWNWYASHKVREDQAEAIRFDLLKSTYRLDRESQSDLYVMAEEVAAKLALNVPVTIYQAQNPSGLNASLAYLPDEAHIVLHGAVTSKLDEAEVRALLAHELSHLLLWQIWDGDLLIVDQILAALTHDTQADTPHFAAARLFGLFSEVFCDRGSLFVAADPLVVISMLVKVCTGLGEVNAKSYLRQAEEVFSKGGTKTQELTHPEAFIRARALKLWAEKDPESATKIEAMIAGPPVLEELDLLAQEKVQGLTRRLIDGFLAPKWLQTELVLAHARLFFDDYGPPQPGHSDATLADALRNDDKPLRDYFCYVLLDLVTADRDLEELPLAAALAFAEKLQLKESFVEIARKELRLRKKQLDKIDAEKANMLSKAGEGIAAP